MSHEFLRIMLLHEKLAKYMNQDYFKMNYEAINIFSWKTIRSKIKLEQEQQEQLSNF